MLFVTNPKRPKDTSTELEGEMRSNSRKCTPMNSIHKAQTRQGYHEKTQHAGRQWTLGARSKGIGRWKRSTRLSREGSWTSAVKRTDCRSTCSRKRKFHSVQYEISVKKPPIICKREKLQLTQNCLMWNSKWRWY